MWNAWLTGNGTALYPAFCERLHGQFDRGARAADHRLLVAVEIGDDHVAVDRLQDALDLRRAARTPPPSGRYPPIETRVISRPRALTASSASANGRAPAATSAPYSPRLCPMVISGRMP